MNWLVRESVHDISRIFLQQHISDASVLRFYLSLWVPVSVTHKNIENTKDLTNLIFIAWLYYYGHISNCSLYSSPRTFLNMNMPKYASPLSLPEIIYGAGWTNGSFNKSIQEFRCARISELSPELSVSVKLFAQLSNPGLWSNRNASLCRTFTRYCFTMPLNVTSKMLFSQCESLR